MATPTEAIGAIDKFIEIAKEIAKLPALVLPQYQRRGDRNGHRRRGDTAR